MDGVGLTVETHKIDVLFIADTQITSQPSIKGYGYTGATAATISERAGGPVRGMGIFHRIPIRIIAATKYNVWFVIEGADGQNELLIHGCYWPVAGHAEDPTARREYEAELRKYNLNMNGKVYRVGTSTHAREPMGTKKLMRKGVSSWTSYLPEDFTKWKS